MKVLILSCGTGGGHNACAQGIYEALLEEKHVAVYLDDYLSLAGKWKEKAVCKLYTGCVMKSPTLFQLVYSIGRVVSSLNHKLAIMSPVYYANARMEKYVKKVLRKDDFDVVIATHLYPAETLTALKRSGFAVPKTVAVATDYTSIPFWEETDCDHYILPHKDCIAEFVKRGIPKEKLVPAGIPAPLQFQPRVRKEKKRGLSILIMGGSMGAGNLFVFVEQLKEELDWAGLTKTSLYVICGTNKKVYDRLRKRWRKEEEIHICSYVHHPERLMYQCDLLFTKPGGLTSTESAICRIPTVFLEPVSQCEAKNAEFFVRHGMALAPKGTRACIVAGIALLKEKEAREQMKRRQEQTIPYNCAKDVVHIIDTL